jgi:hypothetical protein
MSERYRCTECDETFDDFDDAAQCHWGIGGVVEVEDGTSGQDRESYTDDQDRDNYTVEPTFKIVRFRFQGDNEVIETGLTLEEAQSHCEDPETSGDGWFDGYQVES